MSCASIWKDIARGKADFPQTIRTSHSHPAKKKHPTPQPTPAPTPDPVPPSTGGDTPVFSQPQPTPDPTAFKVPHPSDNGLYKKVNDKLLEPIPPPRGGAAEPILTLAEVYGDQGDAKITAIQQAGQIVFHCVGDTGSVKGPQSEDEVSDKMVSDFSESDPANVPSFFFHLGDVVYSFGEAKYYYDQFYEPYREYPAPIIAIPAITTALCTPAIRPPRSTPFCVTSVQKRR